MLTIEATSHHQPHFLTCMTVQVHRIPSDIKHNGRESFSATEGEISSKLPLLLNSWQWGLWGGVCVCEENTHFSSPEYFDMVWEFSYT